MIQVEQKHQPKRLQALQGLRGIAALLVVIDHTLLISAKHDFILNKPYSHWAVIIGSFGVYIFFIISGFIMVHTSYTSFGKGRTSNFIKRRLARIGPLYWLFTLIVYFKNMLSGSADTTTKLLGSMAFITAPGGPGEPMQPILGRGWTLTYEMVFYAIFSLGLLFSRRLGLLFVIGTIFIIVALGAFLNSSIIVIYPRTWLEFYTSPIIILFVVGLIFGISYRKLNIQVRFGLLISAVTIVVSSACLMLGSEHPLSPLMIMLATWLFATVSVIPAVFDYGIYKESVGVLLETLGDASYSLYLIHPLVLEYLVKLLQHSGPRIEGGLFMTLAVPVACASGFIVNRFIEQPILRHLLRRQPITGGVAGASAR